MATQVQRRRGTTAQNAAFTGVEGEVTLDTQTHRLITHDGATVGGFILAGIQVSNIFSAVQTINVASGALSLPLDIQVDGLSRASINNQGYLSLLRQEADTGISGIDVFKRGTTGNALAAVSASSGIGGFNFRAWSGASFSGTVAAMRAFAAETFTATAQGTFIVLSTAQIGTTVLSENVRFQTLATGSFVSFGGTSSSFPALKRSGTQLLVRLADDSADAGFQAGATTLSGLLQFAGTTHAGIRVNNLTTAQRDAIAAPANGMLIFNSTTGQFEGYDSGWGAISGGGSSPPFADSTALVAGSVDPTKLLRFEVDGLTTATTRVLTPQDADYTIAGLETLNVFTVTQTIGAGNQIILEATGAATFSPPGGGQLNIDSTLSETISFEGAGINVGGGESFLIGGNLTFDTSGGGSIISIDSDGPTTVWSISGTGAAGFVTGQFTGLTTMLGNGIGATPTDRLQLSNTTAAAAGAQQYSPALRFTGQGWKTNATAGSQAVDWRIYNQPVQGAANPTGTLRIESSINGAAFGNAFQFNSDGSGIMNANFSWSGGGNVTMINNTLASGGGLFWSSRSVILSPADGQITLLNAALNSFSRLNFGGTTSSFPAIRRTTTSLNIRLADDSADAGLTALSITTSQATFMHITSVALSNGAGVSLGTLANAPAAGDPTKWIPINDNGTTRYIPAW